MLTSGISFNVTDSFSPGTTHLKNTNKNMVRTTYGKMEYLSHVMYPGHSLVPMLSMLLKVRRAWEQGRHVGVGFTIGVDRELNTHFHFVTIETGINFVRFFSSINTHCFLLCACLLAEIDTCCKLFSQTLASFWMNCSPYFICHFLHNLHRIL